MDTVTDQKFSLNNLDVLMRPGATIEKRDEGRHAGCWVKLANGWTLSVQWGCGNYSDNYNRSFDREPEDSTTAEIAVWRDDDPHHSMIAWGRDEWGETVQGYVSMARVQHILERDERDELVSLFQPPPPEPEPRAFDGWTDA